MKFRIGKVPFFFLLGLILLPVFPGKTYPGEPFVLSESADRVQRAEVVLDSYSFSPSHLIVEAGKPVELTLRRKTRMVPHNFVIQAPELGVEINVEVPRKKSVTVRFMPTGPGEVKIFCDKRLLFFKSHEKKGMVGKIEIVSRE